jgi:hypothetical protein
LTGETLKSVRRRQRRRRGRPRQKTLAPSPLPLLPTPQHTKLRVAPSTETAFPTHQASSNHEGDRPHPGRPVRQPDRCVRRSRRFRLVFKGRGRDRKLTNSLPPSPPPSPPPPPRNPTGAKFWEVRLAEAGGVCAQHKGCRARVSEREERHHTGGTGGGRQLLVSPHTRASPPPGVLFTARARFSGGRLGRPSPDPARAAHRSRRRTVRARVMLPPLLPKFFHVDSASPPPTLTPPPRLCSTRPATPRSPPPLFPPPKHTGRLR